MAVNLPLALKRQVPRLRDWNIGTFKQLFELWSLETTSTSITRLKRDANGRCGQGGRSLKRQVPRLRDWNRKFKPHPFEYRVHTWNDKYLDYEIETRLHVLLSRVLHLDLKRQVPRLRDWNGDITFVHCLSIRPLETTSTSITRLKPRLPPTCQSL